MTFPNKLTLSRIFAAPIYFFVWYASLYHGYSSKVGTLILAGIFILCEITDLLDGYIARTTGQISDLGKIMDPFSDVFLRLTYFICFLASGLMPVWTLAIILWRELSIILIRLISIQQDGIAIAANFWGKLKSLLYFFAASGGLVGFFIMYWGSDLSWADIGYRVIDIIFMLSAIVAFLSFLTYFKLFLEIRKKL